MWSLVVVQNLKKKTVNPFWLGKWGKFVFFSYKHTVNQNNFFHLVYRSQTQKYVKHMEFKTHGLTDVPFGDYNI